MLVDFVLGCFNIKLTFKIHENIRIQSDTGLHFVVQMPFRESAASWARKDRVTATISNGSCVPLNIH